MNRLRIVALSAAMIVATSTHARLVQMPTSDASASQFLEDTQVSRTGDIVSLTFINELSSPRRVITKRRNYSYASQTFTARFDCRANTYKIENLTLHSGSMGAGESYPGEGAYKGIRCGERFGPGRARSSSMIASSQLLVHLLGTSHEYQWADSSCSADSLGAFQAFVAKVVLDGGVQAVAEEMSLDALRMHGRESSTVRDLCDNRGWKHVYCDPTEQQQRERGIANDGAIILGKQLYGWTDDEVASRISIEYDKRERFWLAQIRLLQVSPVLLICGSLHVSRFQELARTINVSTAVVASNWAATSCGKPKDSPLT